MIDITRNRQVIQIYSTIVRSSDLKIANQNNNLLTTMIIDDPTADYVRTVEDVCIPMITRFDQLIFVFRDMDGKMMRLNGEFELQLTIEDVMEEVPSSMGEASLPPGVTSSLHLVCVVVYGLRVAQCAD